MWRFMALKSAPNVSGEFSVNTRTCATAARIAIIALGAALGDDLDAPVEATAPLPPSFVSAGFGDLDLEER